ncbi:MAG TPA: PASTA domain-containing protein [Acidimicrobiales bacterium]|nr:PASTA domain-containing protein [Acidimicrobiales bacterium]
MAVTTRRFARGLRDASKRWGLGLLGVLGLLAMLVVAPPLAPSAEGSVLPSLIAYSYGNNQGGIAVVPEGEGVLETSIYPSPADGDIGFPQWSPNGLVLAFHVYAPYHGNKIVLTTRSGTVIAAYPVNGGYGLDWSPAGTQIAYLCDEGKLLTTPGPVAPVVNGFWNVCVLNLISSVSRVIASSTLAEAIPKSGSETRLSWSPDDTYIVVSGEHDIPPNTRSCSGLACGIPDIDRVTVATGEMSPLGYECSFNPAYSPNGAEIAFTNNCPSKNGIPGGIDIMSASGTDVRNVVPADDEADEADWSPDGKQLVFVTQVPASANGFTNVFTTSVKGGPLTQATNTNSNDQMPSWGQPLTVCTVPNLKGQTLAAAKDLVPLAGCVLGTVSGPKKNNSTLKVISQTPAPGTNVPTGTKVDVQLQ